MSSKPPSWLGTVGLVLDRLLGLLLRLLLFVRDRVGSRPALHIVVPESYATIDRCVIRGRVVEDRGQGSQGEGHPVRQALAKLRRTEIPQARVRASVQECSWEVTADTEGFFQFDFPLPAPLDATGGWGTVDLEVVDAPVRSPSARTEVDVLVPPDSATMGILSDIDDTVVRSDSGDKLQMAARVLLQDGSERDVVPGVAPLYHALQAGASGRDGNPIFYHSSASWNTFEHLRNYLADNGIPQGPTFLRHYTARALLETSDIEHKAAAIEEILSAYSGLPFILIGDSAGDDAEAYLDAVRGRRDQVRAVYLRRTADAERAHQVEGLIRQVRELGTEGLMVDSSAEIEEHAAQQGWIVNRSRAESDRFGASATR